MGEISRPVMGGGRGRCRATVVGAGDWSEWVLGIGRVIVHEKVYTRSAYRFVVNNFVSELVCLNKKLIYVKKSFAVYIKAQN